MADQIERRCDKCYYFSRHPSASANNYGQCRRDPPKARDPSFGGTQFPVTYPDDWCGEFMSTDYTLKPADRLAQLAAKAKAIYDAMSPEEKAAHDQAQRGTTVGMMPTGDPRFD